ncbi:MAG: N-acetylmuramoyl-L-alanine amidase [Bacillota bacterium]|nr:N-acetylmuramoyl-L-alanine amidase [Bacillota bacterium]
MVKSSRIHILVVKDIRKYLLLFLIIIIGISFIGSVILARTATMQIKNEVIVIDPGHGGIDGGTNDNSTFLEKDVNLQISLKLKDLFVSDGYQADLTRDSDVSLDDRNNASSSRHERDLIARVTQINNGKYDLFLSIHVDRSSNPNTKGQIVLYSPSDPMSEKLALCIQNRLNAHMKHSFGNEINRLPQKANLFILRNSNTPGVLIETGFISNEQEKKLLKTDSYQSKIAQAILDGVKDYLADKESY